MLSNDPGHRNEILLETPPSKDKISPISHHVKEYFIGSPVNFFADNAYEKICNQYQQPSFKAKPL